MEIKVLITRRVAPKKLDELDKLIDELSIIRAGFEGFISAETLIKVDDPAEVLVISDWSSLDEWMKWVFSPERTVVQERIDALVGHEIKHDVYRYKTSDPA